MLRRLNGDLLNDQPLASVQFSAHTIHQLRGLLHNRPRSDAQHQANTINMPAQKIKYKLSKNK